MTIGGVGAGPRSSVAASIYSIGMLVFRIVCAVAVASAVVWVLAQPEAAAMVRSIPDIGALAPVAGAYVGAFNLAVRQGWGLVVALANGVWAGILSIVAAGVLYTAVEMARAVVGGEISGLGGFFDRFGDIVDSLVATLDDATLLTLALAAAAAAGVLTELIHWALVRVRSKWQRSN